MNNASSNKNIVCGRCNRAFNDKTSLAAHTRAKHQASLSGPKNRNNNNSRTSKLNYDGTLRRPNQAREEANFGSSASVGSIQRTLKTNSGIQEAVAGIIGTTPEGRAWALAALHPCGAGEVVARNIGVVNGMCDTMTSAVATPVYRSENHISYSPILFAQAVPSPSTYGIDIIVPPIPEIDFCYRLIDDSTQQTTGWIVVRLPKYELPTPGEFGDTHSYNSNDKFTTFSSVGYGKVRQIAIGHTFELDAAGLNDQGRVVVGQMEGQWRSMPLSVPSFTAESSQFITGVDFSAQTTTQATGVTDVTVNAPQASSNVWYLEIPTDPSVITSSCPNAYQGLAKHGAYVVQKFTSPLLGYAFKRTGSEDVFQTDSENNIVAGDPWPFVPTSGFAIETRKLGSTLATADAFWNKDPSLPQWSAFGDHILPVAVPNGSTGETAFVSQSALHPGVSEPSDMMTAVIMFRNLPAGGLSGVTSSVRVKSRNYYESISNGLNPAVAPYVHPPAQFDFQALNSVIIAGKQLADGYPASANSLSTILNKVWGALKQYVRPIANTVGTFELPVVSGLARLLDKGITLGEQHEGSF